jgi:hypothetical protein
MSIKHVIATLRYANIAFLTGKISRHDATRLYESSMTTYHSYYSNVSTEEHKKCVQILSSNLLQALNE